MKLSKRLRKKIICATMFALSSLCVAPALMASTVTVVTQSSNLNIRSGPGQSYSIIGSIPKGGTATYLDYKNGWTKVKYGNITGWCDDNYLDHNDD